MDPLTRCIYFLFTFLVLSSFASPDALGADYTADLVRPTASDERIENLSLDDRVDVTPLPGVIPHILLKLSGKYTRKNWSLALQTDPIIPSARTHEDFTIQVAINRQSPRFEFIAVGPRGDIQKEQIEVTFTNWEFVRQMTKKGQHMLAFSIGPSKLGYTEGTQVNYSASALTAKAAYNFRLPSFPRFDIGTNAFTTVLTLSNNIPVDVRFIGFNVRGGYAFIFDEEWRVSLSAGFYLISMYNTNNQFGFRSLMGPQLYPSITRIFGNNSISAYFKYSPIGQSFGIADLSQRELSGGTTFSHIFGSGLGGAVSVDISNLNATIDSIPISTFSGTLSTSIYWTFNLF